MKILKVIVLFIFVYFVFSLVTQVEARRGCCSHHGGVRADGCGCNDGTPLSAKCAPYYVCSAVTVEKYSPVLPTNKPIPTNTPRPTATTKPTRTLIPTKAPIVTSQVTKTQDVTMEPTIRDEVSKQRPLLQKNLLQLVLSLFGIEL